jgi:DNA-binding NarL/FixJ family response regulator
LPEFKRDLVVSDIAMPGLDGCAVLSEVRAIERRSDSACQSRLFSADGTQRTVGERSRQALIAYFADLLGEDKSKELLGQTLQEEKAANEKLTQIAKSRVNREALQNPADEQSSPSPRRVRG